MRNQNTDPAVINEALVRIADGVMCSRGQSLHDESQNEARALIEDIDQILPHVLALVGTDDGNGAQSPLQLAQLLERWREELMERVRE